jgi:hypothetical protein
MVAKKFSFVVPLFLENFSKWKGELRRFSPLIYRRNRIRVKYFLNAVNIKFYKKMSNESSRLFQFLPMRPK